MVIIFFYEKNFSKKSEHMFYKQWEPTRVKRTFYSEILDRKITTKFTHLALDMVDAAFGFDAFILEVMMRLVPYCAVFPSKVCSAFAQ